MKDPTMKPQMYTRKVADLVTLRTRQRDEERIISDFWMQAYLRHRSTVNETDTERCNCVHPAYLDGFTSHEADCPVHQAWTFWGGDWYGHRYQEPGIVRWYRRLEYRKP